jgi:hypothetical protein
MRFSLALVALALACTAPSGRDPREGEGDATEGEGDAAEGEGDAAEGEGDAAEGEGDAAEGEGDAAEGEGEGELLCTPPLAPAVVVAPAAGALYYEQLGLGGFALVDVGNTATATTCSRASTPSRRRSARPRARSTSSS